MAVTRRQVLRVMTRLKFRLNLVIGKTSAYYIKEVLINCHLDRSGEISTHGTSAVSGSDKIPPHWSE